MTDTLTPTREKTPGADPTLPGMRARIAALEVGETLSEATRVELGASLADLSEHIGDEIEKLRNRINPQIARAKAATGHVFTVENGSFLTRSRDLIIAFAVTRVE